MRADRIAEALEAIIEAGAMAERSGDRYWCAVLHRLRAVFLAAVGAEASQIDAWFSEAIRIAKKQKSVSLEKRADAILDSASWEKMKTALTLLIIGFLSSPIMHATAQDLPKTI